MSKKVIIGILFLVIVIVGIYFLSQTTITSITAMEAYEVAEHDVKGKYEDAYLLNIKGGKFPISSGDLAAWVEGGLCSRWVFTYFSPSQNLVIRATAGMNQTTIATSTADETSAEELSASEHAIEAWQLDSSQVFEIAKQEAKKTNHGTVPVTMETSFELHHKDDIYLELEWGTEIRDPQWKITFFPKEISHETIAFLVYINARTGEITRTTEKEYKYIGT